MSEQEHYDQSELFSVHENEGKTHDYTPPSLLQLDLLLALSDGPNWPYALFKQLKSVDVGINQASIYKSVGELTARGLVEPVGKARGKTGHEVTLFDLSTSGRETIIVELNRIQGVLQRGKEKGFID